MRRLFFLIACALMTSLAVAQTASVTQCEWFVGADPGVGNATPISIGAPGGVESLTFPIATGSFTAGQITESTDPLQSGQLALRSHGHLGTSGRWLAAAFPCRGNSAIGDPTFLSD